MIVTVAISILVLSLFALTIISFIEYYYFMDLYDKTCEEINEENNKLFDSYLNSKPESSEYNRKLTDNKLN